MNIRLLSLSTVAVITLTCAESAMAATTVRVTYVAPVVAVAPPPHALCYCAPMPRAPLWYVPARTVVMTPPPAPAVVVAPPPRPAVIYAPAVRVTYAQPVRVTPVVVVR
jgi:hypothetical protein